MASKSKNQSRKLEIFAYGFDQAGFDVPTEMVAVESNAEVIFPRLSDQLNLDSADGVIIPQGIFEDLHISAFSSVRVNQTLLQDRLREVFNLVREGKWVCFLFKLKKEEEIESQLSEIMATVANLNNELEYLQRYKIILTSSGDVF